MTLTMYHMLTYQLCIPQRVVTCTDDPNDQSYTDIYDPQ